MKTNIIALTNKGLVRKNNEDQYLIDKTNNILNFKEANYTPKVLVVFDGIGGLGNGDVASLAASNIFKEMLTSETVVETIICANNDLEAIRLESETIDSFGTTTAGIVFDEKDLHVFNMGDSRVYRYRSNMLLKLTEDHSYGEDQTNLITSYLPKDNLNLDRDLFYEVFSYGKMTGDIFILTTDGITDLVSDLELKNIFDNKFNDLETKIKLIEEMVLNRGAKDNFTIIIYEVR